MRNRRGTPTLSSTHNKALQLHRKAVRQNAAGKVGTWSLQTSNWGLQRTWRQLHQLIDRHRCRSAVCANGPTIYSLLPPVYVGSTANMLERHDISYHDGPPPIHRTGALWLVGYVTINSHNPHVCTEHSL